MINIKIQTQPDDVTCGPTSLHSVYEYYGDTISLEQTITEIKSVATGGTLSPYLGKHALNRGYDCCIYAYNIDVFDPTWFYPKILGNDRLIRKLTQQLEYKTSPRIVETTTAYIHYLELGGKLLHHNLTAKLIKSIFTREIPIITGLSATYLYKSMREIDDEKGKIIFDDLKGEPSGHFVVLCGYDASHRHIVIADPHKENPISGNNYYKVSIARLINAIMLGVLTYDANLLLITKKENA